MRIREILFEARIYNQNYLEMFIYDFSINLSQKAKDFMKRLITKAAQEKKYQITPKLKRNATEWDKKDLENGTLVTFVPSIILIDKLSHIRGWLLHPDITEQDLNSLRGIQDIDIAYDHADRFFSKLNKKASSAEDESGLETIMTWPDGFKLVKLKTEQCLNREGKLMQHCVGSYANEIQRGTEILSLRDPQNNPHVTIEKNGHDIDQIKGKNNKAPIEKYHQYILDYLNKNDFDKIKDLHYLGLIKVNGKIYELNNLPDNLIINGTLNLQGINIKKLPENLTINGSLYTFGCSINELPKGLKINGVLYASRSALETLPEDIIIDGSIDISYTNIKELPKSWNGKTINGGLDISRCPIKELPKGLKINGVFSARFSKLIALPEELDIKRYISIHNTNIKELPKSWNGKTINGHLNIANCPIKELPENLTITETLYINNTLITKLPDTLRVKYNIYISKDMNLTYIPEHLKTKIVVR